MFGGEYGRVDLVIVQALQQAVGLFLRQHQPHLRPVLLQGLEQERCQVGADGGDRAETQGAGHRVLEGLGGLADDIGLLEYLPRMLQNHLAGRCDLDAAVTALEQGHAQFLLQLLDLPRQGWLADETLFRGTAEMARLRDGYQVLQVPQVHQPSPRSMRWPRKPPFICIMRR